MFSCVMRYETDEVKSRRARKEKETYTDNVLLSQQKKMGIQNIPICSICELYMFLSYGEV